nr:hypothetical protein [Tanacetum cinerariifolium]
MGIHDFLCLPEWTSAEVQEEPYLDVRPTLQRLPFYFTLSVMIDVVILNPTIMDLSISTLSSKILVQAKAFQKRKASTFGVTSSYVAKRTRPTTGYFNMDDVRCLSAHVIKSRDMPEGVLVLSWLSRVWKNRFCNLVLRGADGNGPEGAHLDVRPTLQRLSFYCTPPATANAVIPNPTLEDLVAGDDDDACMEIPLVTLFRYAAVIPSSGNQDGNSVAPTAEGSNTQGNRQRPSSGPAPSFMDVSCDVIHTDFFPFSAGPYYATYLEDDVAGNCEFTQEEWDSPYRPSFGVLTKEVFKDPAVCKTIVDQFPTLGDMVRVEVSSLKGYEEKVTGLTRLELQVSTLKKQVYGLNDKLATLMLLLPCPRPREKRGRRLSPLVKGQFQGLVWKFLSSDEFSRVQGELLSLAASVGFKCGLNMHQTKNEFAAVLKKMIFEYAAEPLSVILQLEPEKLVRLANVPILKDTRVSSPIAKEPTVTSVSKSLELSANVIPASFAVTLEQNEEQVSAAVDGSDFKMIDGTARSKTGGVFVQGTSHVLDDVAEVTVVGSERVSSGLTDVVVALSAGEKGKGAWYAREHLLLRAWGKLTIDVLLSIQRILSHATRPKPNGFPL